MRWMNSSKTRKADTS
ncbi:unnamed protein product [Linum tenue]|uniref:Uncharacterized protein n=1 Tax=Linum tenue TaxID=586396 RepID=A0AAV0PQ88_9ROSI|nr:unnamed protein product [Linum tenue]